MNLTPVIVIGVLLLVDALLYRTGRVRSSLIVGQLMMVMTVYVISFTRSKLEVDKRNLNVRDRKNFKNQ